MSKNITPAAPASCEVVGANVGPILSDDDRAMIERIANGETVEGVDVTELDHVVVVGLSTSLKTADDALVDVAGFLGAALSLKTWKRVARADGAPYVSELDFVETQINAHPTVAAILKGTEARKAVVAAVGTITDAKGKPVGLRKMGEILGGVSKSQMALDKAAAAGASGAEGATGAARGPQTGGQSAPTATAVKRHVTGFESAGTRVRDDLQNMTPEQVIMVAEHARDTLSATIAFAKLQAAAGKTGFDLPDWAVAFAKSDAALQGTAKPRLKSGAEGTIGTGVVTDAAPAAAAPAAAAPAAAAPKPKPRGGAAAAAAVGA